MYTELDLYFLRIIYGGKDFGNMDFRFEDKQLVIDRRNRLETFFPGSSFVMMNAEGKDSIIDLGNQRPENWSMVRGDGLLTDRTDIVLALFPADCIPLVIYSVDSNFKALIHIGHTGASLGIHLKAIDYLIRQKNQNISSLRFYIGPSIRQKSYFFESIDESQKNSTDWKQYIDFKDSRYYIDLQGFVVNQLTKVGVFETHITDSKIDTFGNEYFSHRRSVLKVENEGRNLFVVGS